MKLSELANITAGGQEIIIFYENNEKENIIFSKKKSINTTSEKSIGGRTVYTTALDELLDEETGFPLLDGEIYSLSADETGKIHISVKHEFPAEYLEYDLITKIVPPSLIKNDKNIPLKKWAEKNHISPDTARQKALKGLLKTAYKSGRDWFINENEPNIDNRKK